MSQWPCLRAVWSPIPSTNILFFLKTKLLNFCYYCFSSKVISKKPVGSKQLLEYTANDIFTQELIVSIFVYILSKMCYLNTSSALTLVQKLSPVIREWIVWYLHACTGVEESMFWVQSPSFPNTILNKNKPFTCFFSCAQ